MPQSEFDASHRSTRQRRLRELVADLRQSEERFHNLADNMAQLAWMAEPNGERFWFNKRWLDYTGLSLEQVRGWGWRSSHHPDHVERVVAAIKQSEATGEPWEDTVPLRGRDGAYRWFIVRAMPIRNSAGQVVRWFGTNTDVTEQQEWSERNAQFARIVATSPDAILSIAPDGSILSWNPGAERIFGYSASEVVGRSIGEFYPDETEAEFRDISDALQRGETVMRDVRLPNKDGRLIDISMNVGPMRSARGRITSFSAVLRDISERKRHEEQLLFVMRELSHRSKNLMAVIQAMAQQTAKSSADLSDFSQKFLQRLQALAAAQDLLVYENWRGASLRDLVRVVVAPFTSADDPKVEIVGADLMVNPTAAQNLGLALNELATNASRHGALSTSSGKVLVHWEFFFPQDGGERRFRIVWSEVGGPPVRARTRTGFGAMMIERMSAQALEANVRHDFATTGVSWSIDMPAKFVVG